jgi:uncharacterized protein YecE (DUF72 family)
MAELRVGTCSWKYSSWRGLVYPETGDFDYLAEYAKHYDTVEIDQWFWSLHGKGKVTLPRPAVVEAYAAAVPTGFKFSIKVPNTITLTHFYRNSRSEPLIENPHFLSVDVFDRFLDLLAPMHPHLGPIMFQFEYLNRKKMASQEAFLEMAQHFISRLPDGFTCCIEIRNPSYLNQAYFDFLCRNGLYHVFIEGYYMPSIFEIYDKHRNQIEELTVIRLHGPDRKGIEEKTHKRWNKVVEAKDDALQELMGMLTELGSREVTTYVNVNNHYEGSAPLTIERIRSRLGQ